MNIIKLVSKNLLRRKGRFIFTLLGITIGMASFVALLSMGGNMQGEIKKEADKLGANIIITPKNWCAYDQISILTGNSLPESLEYNVMEKVSVIEGIKAIPYLTVKTALPKDNTSLPVSLTGIHPIETKEFKGWKIKEGNYFSSSDQRAVVLGSGIANSFNLGVDDTVSVGLNELRENFKIIAVLEETGSNDDTSMFLPLSVVQEIYMTGDKISFIGAKVEDMSKMDSYIAAIVNVANVSVTTDKQLLDSVLSMLGSVNTTLQLISGVALLAAAFGIVNTMMTAITERRREIGIMRAIGGKSKDIFQIFILESGLYGLFGGIIGVGVGYLISIVAGPMIAGSGMNDLLKGAAPEASMSVSIVVTAILFSLVISVVSGLYPAWKASKLTPVEAMSYE